MHINWLRYNLTRSILRRQCQITMFLTMYRICSPPVDWTLLTIPAEGWRVFDLSVLIGSVIKAAVSLMDVLVPTKESDKFPFGEIDRM